jgi:hypothetical protein
MLNDIEYELNELTLVIFDDPADMLEEAKLGIYSFALQEGVSTIKFKSRDANTYLEIPVSEPAKWEYEQ